MHHLGKALTDTNDSLRARAQHTVVQDLDLSVTNTWMDANSEQETAHKEHLDGTRGRTDADGLLYGIEETGSKRNSSIGFRLVFSLFFH